MLEPGFRLDSVTVNGEQREAFILTQRAPGLTITTCSGDANLRDTWNGLAEILLRELSFLSDSAGQIYYYYKGCYRLDFNEQVLNCLITNFCTHHKTPELSIASNARKILDHIAARVPQTPLYPPVSSICFENGIYDLRSQALIPHSPNIHSLIQIPAIYDANAKGAVWQRYIEQVVPKDCVPVIWQMLGLLMVPFTKAQKAIILLGEGSNGKSLFLEGVQRLLGEANFSTLTLSQLNQRFFTSALLWKLANISTEESISKLEDTTVFKALAAGEPISIDIKHKQPIKAKMFARLVLATNCLPSTLDTSTGFFRRFAIIPFPNTFKNDPAKYANTLRLLSQPEELSAAVNLALAALPNTLDYGITDTPSMRKELEQYVDEQVPERKFLDSRLEDNPRGVIEKADIYAAYKEFCEEIGCKMSNREQFWHMVKKLRRSWGTTRMRKDGKQIYMTTGCVWRD
jgi:putative DNA primase/helicase